MNLEKTEGGYIQHHGFLGPTLYDEEGRRAVLICHNPLAPDTPPKPKGETPYYEVKSSGLCGREIVDADGLAVCWAANPVMAALICRLLNVYK